MAAKSPLEQAMSGGGRKGPEVKVYLADPAATSVSDLKKSYDAPKGRAKPGGPIEMPTLAKSFLNVLNGGSQNSIERLAFERDPTANPFSTVYQTKTKLLPDSILKRIAIQDDLVAAVVNTRSQHMSQFGRPRPDRFSMGYIIDPKPGVLDNATDSQKKALQFRIERATELLKSCGREEDVDENDKLTFSQFLWQTARNAVVLGRIAVEAVYAYDPTLGKKRFHYFRPIDAGTIYRAAPQKNALDSIREQARRLLENLRSEKLEPEKFQNDEYAWVQVVEGRPVQAFTHDECFVHNFYPVLDIELEGYPVTPLDTIISQVTTHINITTHNRLYFQAGRAARGMLVIQSEDVDEKTIGHIRQQFNASINSVGNAWRMPVFAVGAQDKITWEPIDNGQRDMEFQYLSDQNARAILSAFQMSPEELPGYQHLSRGTNNQALSESNNEYKMQAARDVGVRPLLSAFNDFLNQKILPLLDEDLAKLATIQLVGLDAETAEKESVRLQQDAPVHMTYDEILEKVEKDPIGKEWGGEYPLNPQLQAIHDKFLTVGQIKERFFGHAGAAKDPRWDYVRDPFYFQNLQFQMQQQQMQMQAQQQQMAAQQGQPPQGGGDGGGAPPGGDGGGGGEQGGGEESGGGEAPQGGEQQETDLTRALDQGIALLSKGEHQLPPSKRALLAKQRKLVTHIMDEWEKDSKATLDEILEAALHHAPTKR